MYCFKIFENIFTLKSIQYLENCTPKQRLLLCLLFYFHFVQFVFAFVSL